MPPNPLISIITINYNGLNDTSELIESIHTHVHSVSYEIIVVDNASKEDEATKLKEKYPSINVISSKVNRGFSGGNNLGIKQAKGIFILLLNNDTYVADDSFHYLIETFAKSPSIGIVCPKICFATERQCIQYAGYTPLSNITLRNKTIGLGEEDNGQYDNPYNTAYAHGAALMISREAINAIGLMPEIFFLYYEEIDWSTSAKEHGYEIWYNGHCTVFHKESQSTGQLSALRTFYMTRNRLLYALRHKKGIVQWITILYLTTIAATKNSIQFIIKKRFDLAAATYKGIMAFMWLPNKLTK
ncbi:glycosyltransferase family 2 protein [uncultured Bacteroides sp.]|uniref:glycosyltransferase family 2 protein n=1 Tax=uncultured Bacteroides sp. TaxID=162156 RepID=UPI002AA7BF00|nr:glycosyltransferase family 2 protein [uncultured Bacteroides sp.]